MAIIETNQLTKVFPGDIRAVDDHRPERAHLGVHTE